MEIKGKPEYCFEGDYLPLGKAIFENDAKKLTELLNRKLVPIDSVGEGGKSGKPTLLMYAVLIEKPDMVEVLLKHRANPKQECLLRNQMKLIDHTTGEEILYHEENPLNWSTRGIKNVSKAQKISGLLIDHGADINGFGLYYYSPLINAVMGHDGKESKEMVDFLLGKGADINAYGDKGGGTVLITAATVDDWNLVNYLLDKGADPHIILFSGWDLRVRIERRLQRGTAIDESVLEKLKDRLINEYNMTFPAVQDKEKGEDLFRSLCKERGWDAEKI